MARVNKQVVLSDNQIKAIQAMETAMKADSESAVIRAALTMLGKSLGIDFPDDIEPRGASLVRHNKKAKGE